MYLKEQVTRKRPPPAQRSLSFAPLGDEGDGRIVILLLLVVQLRSWRSCGCGGRWRSQRDAQALEVIVCEATAQVL